MAGLAVRAAEGQSADGPFRIVELVGEADVASRVLKDVMDAEVAARPPLLVVDMSRLTFIDSWALHVILTAWKRLRAAGCVLTLAGPAGSVRRVLGLTGADSMVAVYDSLQEASRFPRTTSAAGRGAPPPATRGGDAVRP
ncbi:MAG TPA: STAS domain-containing protein [Trebonia sp.]|nr:STAS domain-containing protein [Trebonia sp.]